MAAERVAGEQDDVRRQDERPDANSEMLHSGAVIEPQRLPHIVREEEEEQQRHVQEVAVNVLQDQRKRSLTEVALAGFADRAVRRIGPERLVVGAAIVVAGESKQSRKREDDE